MEPKRSKYDTNPLDENVAHRADESFGGNRSGGATEDISGPTNPIDRGVPQTSRAPGEKLHPDLFRGRAEPARFVRSQTQAHRDGWPEAARLDA